MSLEPLARMASDLVRHEFAGAIEQGRRRAAAIEANQFTHYVKGQTLDTCPITVCGQIITRETATNAPTCPECKAWLRRTEGGLSADPMERELQIEERRDHELAKVRGARVRYVAERVTRELCLRGALRGVDQDALTLELRAALVEAIYPGVSVDL